MNTGNCRTAYFSDRQFIGYSLLVAPSITQKHLTQQHTSPKSYVYTKNSKHGKQSFNHRKMFTTKSAVQPDNCRGSLIPLSAVAVGSNAIQSASRMAFIVQCNDSWRVANV